MADFNQILSLLKGQNIKKPEEQPESNNLFAGLSNINPDVIQQVRQDYLAKQSTDSKLKSAKTITPEVLVALGNMVKETELISVLKRCKKRQDDKEKELFSHRKSIEARYKKQKENLMAKELIGVKTDPKELKRIDVELRNELRSMDLQVLRDMDKEVKYLQQEFVKLNVPLFKVSNDPNDIKLQQKVLFILQDMI